MATQHFDQTDRTAAVFAEAERNAALFDPQEIDFWHRYPDHVVLVFGGETIKPFHNLADLMEFRETLDDITRDASLTCWETKGTWIL